MYFDLFRFELRLFAKRKLFYLLFLSFLLLGLLIGTQAGFAFPNTNINSPFTITYCTAFFSLILLIPSALLAAQILLREKDARFDELLYATPIRKKEYLFSRLGVIVGINIFCFALFLIGLLLGHELRREGTTELGPFSLINYLYPFLIFALPTLFFCTSLLCSVAWLTRSKLLIYSTALAVYIAYMIITIFSGSPLLAGNEADAVSGANVSSYIDPFGLSAFFEQTRYWSSIQRNTQPVTFHNELLINRLLVFAASILALFIGYRKADFTLKRKASKTRLPFKIKPVASRSFQLEHDFGKRWKLQVLAQLTLSSFKTTVKSVPFLFVVLLWLTVLILEITTGEISTKQRMPAFFATSGIMTENILSTSPLIALIVIAFFGSELFWKSRVVGFSALERATPVSGSLVFISRWLALSAIPLLLLLASIGAGIAVQFLWGYPKIDALLYLRIFYFTGLPLVLSSLLIISLHTLIRNKFIALAFSILFLLVTNTSLSRSLGIDHPLLAWANAFDRSYSAMNGFGSYPFAFHISMLYWSSIGALLAMGCYQLAARNKFGQWFKKTQLLNWVAPVCLLSVAAFSGNYIAQHTKSESSESENDKRQQYELNYKKYSTVPQPIITLVQTTIDLHPENCSYQVSGVYWLKNKSKNPQSLLMLYFNSELAGKQLTIEQAIPTATDSLLGHYAFQLRKPLAPGDSVKMSFRFSNSWSPFTVNDPYNAIVENGSFIRISKYFPQMGYNVNYEIEEATEREKRKLPANSPLKKLKALESLTAHEYNYILLDATISTSSDQTIIGTGELAERWTKNGRNYYHYTTDAPIPFRFAVASARYLCKKRQMGTIAVEVYYHPAHSTNIDHLLNAVELTLKYCTQNFGAYSHRTIRFAEISEVAKGFAATAYPGSFFINENFGFENKLADNPEKDIICELTGHELSHSWWGNAQLDPVYGEGSKLMTETLAMYTELMVLKAMYGSAIIRPRILMHRELYMSSRSFADEEPLFISDPSKSYLCYNKGIVVMYQLYQLLGEARINKALHSFLQHYAYPNGPPASSHLIAEFYAVSDSTEQKRINEFFKQIITHSLSVSKAESVKTKTGFQLLLTGRAEKFSEDGKGKTTPVVFSEGVEVLIRFADGTTSTVTTTPKNGRIALSLTLTKQPLSVELDPNVSFMEAQISDNQRAVIEK